MILSTEDHQKLMKNVAAKTDAQLSLIPPVVNESEPHDAENNFQRSFLGTDNYIDIGGACILFQII